MIPYIEIRDKKTKLQKTLILPIDCMFELTYYGVGEFAIKCNLDKNTLASVKKGDFCTIPNKPYIFIINNLKMSYNANNGYVLTIAGKQAKSILSQRIIQNAKLLPTDLASAVNGLILENAGQEASTNRQMGIIVESSTITEKIEQTQAPVGDLLEFTDNLLKTKECGSELFIENNQLKYKIYKGSNKSDRVTFSQNFDNLLNCEYIEDNTQEKTIVWVESEGVFQAYNSNTNAIGLDRKELFFESSISTKYTNEQGDEIELDLTMTTDLMTFKNFLISDGREELKKWLVEETFKGEIDTNFSQYEFGVDYYLGDRVSVKDEDLNKYITPRVTKFTISQNASGYNEAVEYEN